MHLWMRSVINLVIVTALLVGLGVAARAQDSPHVVSLTELGKDSTRHTQTRESDEREVRQLLASERGQKALQSAHIEYKKIDKAISQINDEELAKLAQRSREAQADFAAGRISNTLIVVIVAAAVALIILAATLPKD